MIAEDFNELKTNTLVYGGKSGQKLGVIINGDNWFLKFPKSTKRFSKQVDMSYSTSPLSEYIGSHIYESIGIPVHETKLGIKDGKVVVACKDFRENINTIRFDDYNAINNLYVSGLEEKLSSFSSSSHLVDLEGIMIVMENNPRFLEHPELKERFWDMFIVDALIGNNDRNNGNWGMLVNSITNEMTVAPVFDNGAAFGSNIDDKKMERILNDEKRFEQSGYSSRICAFSREDKAINPFKYIESLKNEDCNAALMRIVPKINVENIQKMINEIPNEVNGIQIISDVRKEFYCKCIEYRYEKSLYPTYLKIKEINKTITEENNKDSFDDDDVTVEFEKMILYITRNEQDPAKVDYFINDRESGCMTDCGSWFDDCNVTADLKEAVKSIIKDKDITEQILSVNEGDRFEEITGTLPVRQSGGQSM